MDIRAQRHALLFRRLAAECGGIPKILELGVTRLRHAQLNRFADPLSGCFAPADVIEDLETLCGKPLYTAALAEGLPGHLAVRDLLQEACETSCSAAELMRLVAAAKAHPGGITPRIRSAILDAIDRVAEELRDVRGAVRAEDDAADARGAS